MDRSNTTIRRISDSGNDDSVPSSTAERIGLVWPRPQEAALGGGVLVARRPLPVRLGGQAPWLRSAAREITGLVNRFVGGRCLTLSEETSARGPALTVTDAGGAGARVWPAGAVTRPEGYAISASRDGITLIAADRAGAFYAAQTLAQMARRSDNATTFSLGRIRDWPQCPIRGFHMYMPARWQLDFFYRCLDFLARRKFNTIFLEVGGGMQYERHPEIAEGWRRFCREHNEYPGGARALQTTIPRKNSTHTEVAGSDALPKALVRELVAEARQRHFHVIPEVQSLSHCYYLLASHHELAERREDPRPDSYCPSNPETYRLLFDLMEEVIEVFDPEFIHIGHDEARILQWCSKCRKKSGARLLGGVKK